MLPRSPWSLALGFIAGFLAVVIFHQSMLGTLHVLGFTSAAPFSAQPTRPWGVPVLWSSALWGGLWGVALAFIGARFKSMPPLLFGTLFGAVVVTAGAWFVAAPLKGQPMAAGWVPVRMMIGPLVNGAWGFGTVLIARGLARLPVIGAAR
jgi:hypothetical protein